MSEETLRQFIYLDEYKMYSFYSQLFEGFVDQIVKYGESGLSDSESQKGPVGSGRLLANLTSATTGTQERRFLHDYAYAQFETEVSKRREILTLDSRTDPSVVDQASPGRFIRVSGQAEFNDMRAIGRVISQFNKMGEELAYVTTQAQREAESSKADATIGAVKDRNKRAKLQAAAKSLGDKKRIAESLGLRQDEKFVEGLEFLLQFGYDEQFEIQVRPFPGLDWQFSGILRREALREEESILVRKHGRRAPGEFTIFGIVAQAGPPPDPAIEASSSNESMKSAVRKMALGLSEVEGTFTGALPSEVVVDPIAVYREV